MPVGGSGAAGTHPSKQKHHNTCAGPSCTTTLGVDRRTHTPACVAFVGGCPVMRPCKKSDADCALPIHTAAGEVGGGGEASALYHLGWERNGLLADQLRTRCHASEKKKKEKYIFVVYVYDSAVQRAGDGGGGP